MAKQTNNVNKFLTPDGMGVEISTDEGVTFPYDLGVFEAGVSITHNFDDAELVSGNAGTIFNRAKKETISIAPTTLWTYDLAAITAISGGMFTFSTQAGTPVVGAAQNVLAGWAYSAFIPFTFQNGDASVPSNIVLTGSVDSTLTLNTDYVVTSVEGIWGFIMIASVATLAQDIGIVSDYTPSASTTMTSGRTSTVLTKAVVRLRRYTDVDLGQYDIETILYGVKIDSGLVFNFDGSESETANAITIAMTANVDSDKPDGAQLFSMLIKDSAYTSKQ